MARLGTSAGEVKAGRTRKRMTMMRCATRRLSRGGDSGRPRELTWMIIHPAMSCMRRLTMTVTPTRTSRTTMMSRRGCPMMVKQGRANEIDELKTRGVYEVEKIVA